MATREEIRQRTIEILVKPLKVPYQEDAAEMMVQGAINQAEEILTYLHSQGVVIKVDRELPSSLTFGDLEAEFKEAGYVAVEPLIKEE